MTRRAILLTVLCLLGGACRDTGGDTTTSAAATTSPSSTTAPATTPTTTTTTVPITTTSRVIDLGDHPLVWFGPLPPLPTGPDRPYTGAEDFFELFEPDAPWPTASAHVDVFLLYGEWLGGHATVDHLRRIIEDLDRRGIAVAVEGSPLTRPDDCGTSAESWGGIPEGTRIARKFAEAGGVIDFWAMDAPLAYAHVVDYEGTCRWDPEAVAAEIDAFTRAMREFFPDLVVGDTEPLWRDRVSRELYIEWLDTFRAVTGYDLPFFHLDVDWGRDTWPEDAKTIEQEVRARGIEFGLFYIGNKDDNTDRAWVQLAGERIKAYEEGAGGDPDHVLFQSWMDHPDRTLPDDGPYTFSGLIVDYVESPARLGVVSTGPGGNAAFEGEATASHSLPGFPPAAAVDGDSETWWGAGDFAPQWIEIDLGMPVEVAEVRLRVGQSPDGPTLHRLYAGPTPDALELVHVFDGPTLDLEELRFTPESPLRDVAVVRVDTEESPSWVSWREIEVILAG